MTLYLACLLAGWLLIHVSNMGLCNQSCLSVQLVSHLERWKRNVENYMQTFQPIFHALHAYRHQYLLPFYNFLWPSLQLRVTRSVESKTCWLHFHLRILTHQDEVWHGLDAIKLSILVLFLSKIYWIKGYSCCFTDSIHLLLTLACI